MKKICISLVLFIVAATSCVDETAPLTVPYALVSFRIDLNGSEYHLKTPLSFMTFTEEDRNLTSDRFGFAGLLVVSDATGNAIYAYDLCCPYEDNKTVKVVPGYTGKAVCPNCGSVYITMYGLGSVESGPSMESLQRYSVVPLQSGSYSVRN